MSSRRLSFQQQRPGVWAIHSNTRKLLSLPRRGQRRPFGTPVDQACTTPHRSAASSRSAVSPPRSKSKIRVHDDPTMYRYRKPRLRIIRKLSRWQIDGGHGPRSLRLAGGSVGDPSDVVWMSAWGQSANATPSQQTFLLRCGWYQRSLAAGRGWDDSTSAAPSSHARFSSPPCAKN
jgi:hypothetical protein